MDKEEKKAQMASSSCEGGCSGQCKECLCKKKDPPHRPDAISLPVLTHMVWLLVLCVTG